MMFSTVESIGIRENTITAGAQSKKDSLSKTSFKKIKQIAKDL